VVQMYISSEACPVASGACYQFRAASIIACTRDCSMLCKMSPASSAAATWHTIGGVACAKVRFFKTRGAAVPSTAIVRTVRRHRSLASLPANSPLLFAPLTDYCLTNNRAITPAISSDNTPLPCELRRRIAPHHLRSRVLFSSLAVSRSSITTNASQSSQPPRTVLGKR
jgi:hypothetical protein